MARYQSGYSSSSIHDGRPRSPYSTNQNNNKRHYEDNSSPPTSSTSDGRVSPPIDDVASPNVTSPTTAMELKLETEQISPLPLKRFKEELEDKITED